ncbi:TIGR03915 family putative DNA repair protein [Romboutsia sp.]|uniref:TIGR03915 family putative DNA repair protein n=1 Tax=Romboutsia sp. TaxID=1965302 RepID=UPI003F32EE8F
MNVFIYDGSFEGLLSTIYEAYYSSEKPDKIYSKINYEENLLEDVLKIKTDLEKFQKVYNAIENKISKEALRKIYYVYLSEFKESSNLILSYIRMGFKLGYKVDYYKNNDVVLNMDKISKRVSLEKHRFTGFVRFKSINNILYSSIEPDFNILPIIGKHFKNRLSNEYFIIEDVKRNIALVYDKNNYYLTNLSKEQKNVLTNSKEEGAYADLWREYFKATAIVERNNPRLQKRQMPTRYWNQLTELI